MPLSKEPLDGAVPIAKELRQEVLRIKETRNIKNYDWTTEAHDINFCDFRKKNYAEMCWFELQMDINCWDLFANELGLNADEIKWCQEYHKYGPTQEAMRLLAKKGKLETLTLGDVLNLLKKLKLTSLLTRIKWQDCIGQYRASDEIESQCSGQDMANEEAYSCTSAPLNLWIHQPPEVLVKSANVGLAPTSEKKPKRRFGAKIIMIFASDAKEEALRVISQFKTPQQNRKEIGVMILTSSPSKEIANALMQDPWNSIHKWFKQVDFVVPVLSKQLLRQIQARDTDPSTLQEMQYNRYIYRLLLDDYVSNMSKNYKCRALCPQVSMTEVRSSELVKGNGLLEMNWNCSSEAEVNKLAEILVSGAKSRTRVSKHTVS